MKFCPQGTPRRGRRGVERPSQAEPGRAFRFFEGSRASGLRTSLRYGGIADSPTHTTAFFPMKKTGSPPDSQTEAFRVLFIFEYLPVLGEVATKQGIVKDRNRGITS